MGRKSADGGDQQRRYAFLSVEPFSQRLFVYRYSAGAVPQLDRSDKPQLAHKLAEILDHVNYLHPFREGNGRTQREFLRLLAMEKGLDLNLNPPDNVDVYERYMSGTIPATWSSLQR